MKLRTWPLLAVLGWVGCAEPPEVAEDPEVLLPRPARTDGFQMAMELTAAPYSEVWKCQVGKIPGEGLLNVASVESRQSHVTHHTDIAVMYSSSLAVLKPGIYDCTDLYRDYPEMMDQPILYAAQNKHEKIDLPPGVVAAVPAGMTMMFEIHYVNTTAQEARIWSRVNAYTTQATDVTGIWGTAMRDRNLNIPPKAEHVEWTRCTFDQDIEVLFLSTHTHQLARRTELYTFDGTSTGELVLANDDWTNPILKSFTQAPLKVKAGQGFELRCLYRNDTDKMVHWGLSASDEMCQFAYVFTPGKQNIVCKQVESSDGKLE